VTSTERNAPVVEEFRAHGGKVGGPFEGATLALLHHRGVKSGKEFVTPLAYRRGDGDTIYVFASAAGRPEHPQWYRNITAAGRTEVEVGTETYSVTVEVLDGAERDRIYAAQVQVMPGFADYEQKTEGIRTIPVVALHRVRT
jgi:deazaflavin-dependent oxidoreductase (nitroreductase family)